LDENLVLALPGLRCDFCAVNVFWVDFS